MSIKRMILWLLAVGALTLASSARAQPPQNYDSRYALGNAPFSEAAPPSGIDSQIQPFGPVGFTQKADPFGPANISDYGNGPQPKIGFFFGYDRLAWTISRPSAAKVGSGAAEGTVTENGLPVFESNSVTTDFLTSQFGRGNRWEIGYMDTNHSGWLVGVLDHIAQTQSKTFSNATVLFNDPSNLLSGFLTYIGPDGNTYDADLNGNAIYGRNGQDTGTPFPNPNPPPAIIYVPPLDGIPDTPAPTDFGDLQKFSPKFTTLFVENRTVINGVEIMRIYRYPQLHYGGELEFLYGARFLQVDDFFGIFGTGGILDTTIIGTRVQNDIVGPQIGARWYRQRGRWLNSVEGRVMTGADFQNFHQVTAIATSSTGGIQPGGALLRDAPVNLHPLGGEMSETQYAFSPAVELRLQTSYQITSKIAIKAGYTGLFVDGISRASNRVDYTLPGLGILAGHSDQTLFTQGVNVGFEVNR